MITEKEIIIRLFTAAFFSALIGLERERKHWAAGMRTHMMVCVGSCLVVIVSAFGFSDILASEHVNLDPSRIAAQVVSGIGFIGAGSILFSKDGIIRGLTTAAGLWTVAAIGLATGCGLYFAAGATTLVALIILWVLKPLEQFYTKRFSQKIIKIITKQNLNDSAFFRELQKQYDLKIQTVSYEKSNEVFVFNLIGENIDSNGINAIINALKNEPLVQEFTWVQ